MESVPEPADTFARFPIAWALDPKLSPVDTRVLLVLFGHRNRETGRCDPSQQRIADESGLSVPTVKRALAALRERALITVEPGRGRGQRSRYTIADKGSPVNPLSGRKGVTSDPRKGVTSDPEKGSPVTYELEEGTRGSELEGSVAPLPPPEAGLFEPEPFTVEPEPVAPNAGHLVAAWCEAWTAARDRQPDPSVVKRVAGGCKQIERTRTDRESWVIAWEAAKDAGTRGLVDVVRVLADYRPTGPPSVVSHDVAFIQRALEGRELE